MSWSTAPTLPARKTGPAWTTTAAPPVRKTGTGWFSVTANKVVGFTATGSLTFSTVATYPRPTAAYRGSGALTAVIAPRRAVAAAFTGVGALFPGIAEIRVRAVDFSATGALVCVVNDGLSAIVTGGRPVEDGLTGTVGGGLTDGLTATVTAVVVVGVPATAPLAATGALSATVIAQYLVAAGFGDS